MTSKPKGKKRSEGRHLEDATCVEGPSANSFSSHLFVDSVQHSAKMIRGTKSKSSMTRACNPSQGKQPKKKAPGRAKRATNTVWNPEIHRYFVLAIWKRGLAECSPSSIKKQMIQKELPELTQQRIKSHLQRFRGNLEREQRTFFQEYNEAMYRSKHRSSLPRGRPEGTNGGNNVAKLTLDVVKHWNDERQKTNPCTLPALPQQNGLEPCGYGSNGITKPYSVGGRVQLPPLFMTPTEKNSQLGRALQGVSASIKALALQVEQARNAQSVQFNSPFQEQQSFATGSDFSLIHSLQCRNAGVPFQPQYERDDYTLPPNAYQCLAFNDSLMECGNILNDSRIATPIMTSEDMSFTGKEGDMAFCLEPYSPIMEAASLERPGGLFSQTFKHIPQCRPNETNCLPSLPQKVASVSLPYVSRKAMNPHPPEQYSLFQGTEPAQMQALTKAPPSLANQDDVPFLVNVNYNMKQETNSPRRREYVSSRNNDLGCNDTSYQEPMDFRRISFPFQCDNTMSAPLKQPNLMTDFQNF